MVKNAFYAHPLEETMAENQKRFIRKIQELTALYEISHAMASTLDFKSVLNQILEILSKKLEMNRGTVTLLSKETGQLSIAAAHGLTKEEISRGKYKIGEGVTGKVVEKGEPMIIPDIGKEPLFLNRTKSRGDVKRQNVSFLCLPIKVKGETLGVLSVDRLFKDADVAFEEDVRLLTVVASLIGQNLKIHQMIEKEKERLMEENRELQSELKGRYRLENVVGGSKLMVDVYKSVQKVAATRSTVIIRGESGTGKELIARAIHYNSPRADKPFVKVSCAALPETLLESELFGHEKGSYTGASDLVKGRFELADGGTLFLDEIGDISLATQVKLLRVLQERKFERVGGSKTLSVDVRIIAATNRNLERAIGEGKFREDLYYRLNVVPIFLPSLRERKDDIPLLLNHFLQKYNGENKTRFRLSPEVMVKLVNHPWPGNVRELENTIERMAVMSKSDNLSIEDIPLPLNTYHTSAPWKVEEMPEEGPAAGAKGDGTLADLEKKQVMDAMERCGGVQAKACKILGITPRQLGYRLKKYKIGYKPTFLS
ncbi:MAG TPA: nif-specific transcriptional activator NifA [bacterium]|nr:nif-specific transcriptional activator NifA [bacterium]